MGYKTPEEICAELDKISPLALPEYLSKCEFYDRSNAYEILEKAVNEFKGKGGVAGGLMDAMWKSVVNSVGLCLSRKFLPEQEYRKLVRCGGSAFATTCVKAFSFGLDDYGPEERELYSVEALRQDQLRRNMVRQTGNPNADGSFSKQFDAETYRRNEDFEFSVKNSDGDRTGRSAQFVKDQSKDGENVRGVGGKQLKTDKNNPDKRLRAQGDHVTPLKMIHEQSGYFIERYVNLDDVDSEGHTVLQQIVNDDANFQVLSADKNASKGGGLTNMGFVAYCDNIGKASEIYKKTSQIDKKMDGASPDEKRALQAEKRALQAELKELGVNATQRKAAKKMAHPENLTEEEKADLDKYKLTDKEKEELKKNQKESEKRIRDALLKQGVKSVAMEQIGKIVDAMVGPIGFELRDCIFNGINHGFDGCDPFDAFCKRMWRAFKYVIRRMKEIFADTLGDLGKMFATFFMNACKMLKDFFGKFFDLALSGIGVVVEAVKILLGKGTAAQKGEAILKVIVGFATGILGQTLIDSLLNSLGLPDPFSDIVASILSALLSTLVMALFDKLDLFGMKREMLRKRIDEIFDARKQAIEDACANYDMVASQALKCHRKALETIRGKLSGGLEDKNFDAVNEALDGACELFAITLPYRTPREFLLYLRENGNIIIR